MEVATDTNVDKTICEVASCSSIEVEEQLLGSLTTYNQTEGSEIKSQQIRSSARVFKKMKLDLAPSSLVTEKREKKEDIKQDIKKIYRPLWLSEDKTIFFEALNEFGKDFESIQTYISSKLKKRGIADNMVKTKDQIRHLYYRMWHKVSKHVKFAEGIKKVVQELYGLINYGELRKKIGSVSEKSCMKLSELIYTGSIVLRKKGKTIRIKTPMCRALRRLNQLEEKYDEIKLPNRVTVELRPKDMASFLKVQILAQNPRIRTTLPLQKRLSTLISCVSKRWKTVDAVMYDKSVISSSNLTNDCVPSSKVIDENKALLTPPLRLSPPTNCKIEVPTINLSEYFTRQSICLTAYENRVGIKNTEDYDLSKLLSKNSPKKGFRQRTDSLSDKSEKLMKHGAAAITSTGDGELHTTVNQVVKEAVNTILALQQQVGNQEALAESKAEEQAKIKLENDIISEQKLAQINKIKRGWTEESSQSLTIGEVYLMFGADSKLILEYSWDPLIPMKVETQTNAEVTESNEEPSAASDKAVTMKNDLSNSLSKLLSVAKLHYRKNIIKCPCGHICGPKNNMQLKKAVESKIRKILTDMDKCNNEEPEDKITSEETIFESDSSFTSPPVYIPSNIHHQISPATFFHPPSTPMVHLITQLESIQRLKSSYCNRRGRRPRSKQVVVERKLPLLPNKMESGHQIVRMNIISKDDTTSQLPSSSEEQLHFKSISEANASNVELFKERVIETPIQGTSDMLMDRDNDENHDLLNDNIMSTVPPSPATILKETDSQSWINSEMADYSLSSLLGHLESPMKSAQNNEDSHMSQDVDAQLHSLLTESSVDFSASFADLAAQVNEIKK